MVAVVLAAAICASNIYCVNIVRFYDFNMISQCTDAMILHFFSQK